jgi:cysteinyl-tRNA synthetase
LKFSFEGLESAHKVRLKIIEWMETVAADSEKAVPHPEGGSDPMIAAAMKEFTDAMNMDLNTPGALAPVFTLMNHYYAQRTKKAPLYKEDFRALVSFLEAVRHTFGCFESIATAVPAEMQQENRL